MTLVPIQVVPDGVAVRHGEHETRDIRWAAQQWAAGKELVRTSIADRKAYMWRAERHPDAIQEDGLDGLIVRRYYEGHAENMTLDDMFATDWAVLS